MGEEGSNIDPGFREMAFDDGWPGVLDKMAAWMTDTVIAARFDDPRIDVVIDATRLLAAKEAGARIREDFDSFRREAERRYGKRIRFGWVESAAGHVVLISEGEGL